MLICLRTFVANDYDDDDDEDVTQVTKHTLWLQWDIRRRLAEWDQIAI